MSAARRWGESVFGVCVTDWLRSVTRVMEMVPVRTVFQVVVLSGELSHCNVWNAALWSDDEEKQETVTFFFIAMCVCVCVCVSVYMYQTVVK